MKECILDVMYWFGIQLLGQDAPEVEGDYLTVYISFFVKMEDHR